MINCESMTWNWIRIVIARPGAACRFISRLRNFFCSRISCARLARWFRARRSKSHVWGIDFQTGTNVLDVMVRRLRAKVDDPYPKKLIHTVRGAGYVLKAG